MKFSGKNKKRLQVETAEGTLNIRATGFSRFHAAFRQVVPSGHAPKQPNGNSMYRSGRSRTIETDCSTQEVEVLASFS